MELLYLAGIVDGLKSLGINLPSLLAQLINFTILLVVLYLLAYKPLLKIRDERRRRIQEGLEASEQAKERLARAEEEVATQMERSRQEGQALIGQAQQVSARIQEEARQQARADAEAILTRAPVRTSPMIRDTAAKRYARAAFEAALDRGTLDRWSNDLQLIAAVMGDAEALALLANTKVPLTERYRLLEVTLTGIDPQAMNLARLLVAKGRAGLAPQIAEAYLGLGDEHRGLAPAPVGTAGPL